MQKVIFFFFISLLVTIVICDHDDDDKDEHGIPSRLRNRKVKALKAEDGRVLVAIVPKDFNLANTDSENDDIKIKQTKDGIVLIKDGHEHDLDKDEDKKGKNLRGCKFLVP